MALDGIIVNVERINNDIKITLGPREGTQIVIDDEIVNQETSIPGQQWLLIKDATFEPIIGDEIWGGSGFAQLVSGDIPFPYLRENYTTLIEDWEKSK